MKRVEDLWPFDTVPAETCQWALAESHRNGLERANTMANSKAEWMVIYHEEFVDSLFKRLTANGNMEAYRHAPRAD